MQNIQLRKVMKEKLQRPITDENFNKAWDYVNGKLVEIQKKKSNP